MSSSEEEQVLDSDEEHGEVSESAGNNLLVLVDQTKHFFCTDQRGRSAVHRGVLPGRPGGGRLGRLEAAEGGQGTGAQLRRPGRDDAGREGPRTRRGGPHHRR